MTSASKKVSNDRGFTLVEVLIALAIAAMGFGVVLHSVGLQMALVAGSVDRHQMLLYASQVLETNLPKGVTEETVSDAQLKDSNDESSSDGLQAVPKFLYGLESRPVTADPRVQQVTASVQGSRGGVRLSAYKLRVKRD